MAKIAKMAGETSMSDLKAREHAYRLRHELQLQRRIGIKVRTEFEAPRWWTCGFIDYIEDIASAKLINAAKNYVKSGKVLEINVMPGVVEAQVQGRRKAPYQVRLYSPLPTEAQVAEIERKLSERAVFGAMLLSGEMSPEIKDILAASGVAIMPHDYGKGQLLCSCPEPENTCKHILAVLFVITAVFDRDPFMLLRMRGFEKDRLLSCLTAARAEVDAAETERELVPALPGGEQDLQPEPCVCGDDPQCAHSCGDSNLPLDATFYGGESLPGKLSDFRKDVRDVRERIRVHSPFLDFPLWRGETSFGDSIYPYYESVQKLLKVK